MKKPAATREQKKTEIEQLSPAELVEMVLGLQRISVPTEGSKVTSQMLPSR